MGFLINNIVGQLTFMTPHLDTDDMEFKYFVAKPKRAFHENGKHLKYNHVIKYEFLIYIVDGDRIRCAGMLYLTEFYSDSGESRFRDIALDAYDIVTKFDTSFNEVVEVCDKAGDIFALVVKY